MTQAAVERAEFGGFPRKPWLRIDGRTFNLGDSLCGEYGFAPFAVLDERLMRIIVALALIQDLGAGDDNSWTTAEQLAIFADGTASPDATRKFLFRKLRGYTLLPAEEMEFGRVPTTHLVQYRPLRRSGSGFSSGRSQGPYRLGVPQHAAVFDREACLAFLGHAEVELERERQSLPDAILCAQAATQGCDYQAARVAIVGALMRGAFVGTNRHLCALVADAYHLLGQYAVQLRFPHDAIQSARRARTLFDKLRHSAGSASALLTEAHALGQLGDHRSALLVTRYARGRLENATPQQRRVKRAECAGVTGQRYSSLKEYEAAERHLLRAFRMAQDADDPRQICLWSARRAENALRGGT